MDRKRCSLLVAVVLLCGSSGFYIWARGGPTAPAAESVDFAVVREKIGMLGVRDDSLEYNEQPVNWLKQRREHVAKELIAGLDHAERRVALGCLEVLEGVKGNPKLVDALVRIARQKKHPIHVEATHRLCDFAEDGRARKLLEAAWRDGRRFEDSRWRSRMAAAVGEGAAAVELLVPLLRQGEDHEVMDVIRQLGQVGHKTAIGPLELLREDERWVLASEAYLVLARIDPRGHGLTEGQIHFLQESNLQAKANRDFFLERWKMLISLERTEIRGMVLSNVHSDRPGAGLVLLQLWRDKKALPVLKELMDKPEQRWRWGDFAAAYLDIEGTDRSIDEMIKYVRQRREGRFRRDEEDCLRAVVQSIMPAERKLEVLSAFRKNSRPMPVARSLRFAGEDQAALLEPLLREETDWPSMGIYVQIAAMDQQQRFGKSVESTLDRLVKALAENEEIDPDSAKAVLDASVKYSLPGSGKKVERLLSHPEMRIRIAAARPAALLGGDRTKAMAILFEALGREDEALRKLSAEQLAGIPCLTEQERRRRETKLLAHVGGESEDYALCVLAGCAGSKTAQRLLPILDETDVQRAVYAAWVLAQHSDETVRGKALRRVTLYGMFRHQVYQAGSGIDFEIAPGLSFHQVTGRLNPQTYQQRESSVQIPDGRYIPANLDEKERQFSIRAYRHTRLLDSHHHIHGLDMWRPREKVWDESHLPLLEVIAREDPFMRVLVIKDRPVVHFHRRQQAARAIANVTSEKAFYRGLSGEWIESQQMPARPYDRQAEIAAKFLMDLAQEVVIEGWRDSRAGYTRVAALRTMINNLTSRHSEHDFGDRLKARLAAEARKRGLGERFERAGFHFWTDTK